VHERLRLEEELKSIERQLSRPMSNTPLSPSTSAGTPLNAATPLSPTGIPSSGMTVSFEDYQRLYALMQASEKSFAEEIVILSTERDDMANSLAKADGANHIHARWHGSLCTPP
jgi:hypothetical protein